MIQYPKDLTVALLGTFVNETAIDTVVRTSEGTLLKKPEAMIFEPARGVKKPKQEIATETQSRNEGHADLALAHIRDFLQCVRDRKTPRGDLELAYRVQTPLIMAMQSHMNNKVAIFDPDKEAIRLV